ncbi:MAG: phosphatase PAP2 family protein [Anaerolineales bacterium]|jgi:membrane-associated phospholipid phosphatase
MSSNIYDISIFIIQVLQNIGDWFIVTMKFFSFLGVVDFYLLVMPVIVWALDYNFGLRLGVMLLLSSGFNSLIKMGFHQPRPFWTNTDIKQLDRPWTDFGIPSGHSMTPLAVYGLIAATLKRRWVTILISVVIFLIGLSRMALGVHFIQDVLAGWIFGLLVLWLFIRFEGAVKDWLGKRSLSQKLFVIFLFSLVIVFIGALILVSLGEYEIPQSWQANALLAQPEDPLAPLSLNGLVTSAGTLFGLAVGGFWIEKSGGFNDEGKPWQRILRFIIGLVGVVILWQGLGSLLPRNQDFLSLTLRYLRYTLTGLWISGLAPMLFMKLKLAKQKE